MNVQQGDLAIIVESKAGNVGKIVSVIRFVGEVKNWAGKDRWEIDRKLVGDLGNYTNTVRDSSLRPIRDQPGTDETLSWAKVPETTKRLTEAEFDAARAKWGEKV